MSCCWMRKTWGASRLGPCTWKSAAGWCGSTRSVGKQHFNRSSSVALNVLVVDDSSVARSVILKSLRLAGFELGTLHEATNGVEGLEVLEKNWIDLAFVDINMPKMDGEEMIRRVRQNQVWQDLPIVVVST